MSAVSHAVPQLQPHRALSSSSWEADYARTHVSTSPVQKAFLFASSTVLSLLNTHRGDMVSMVGETFVPEPALRQCRVRMLSSEEGSDVLRTKPRVLDATRAHFATQRTAPSNAADTATASLTLTAEMELEWLRSLYALPVTTFGHRYAEYMLDHGYTPSGRSAVRFVDDPELAYVMQRYREVHDFLHVLTAIPPSVQGELALKALEFFQTGLPSAAASVAVAGALRLPLAGKADLLTNVLPWARRVSDSIDGATNGAGVLSVRYEDWFNDDIALLRGVMGITEPYVESPAVSAAAVAVASPKP